LVDLKAATIEQQIRQMARARIDEQTGRQGTPAQLAVPGGGGGGALQVAGVGGGAPQQQQQSTAVSAAGGTTTAQQLSSRSQTQQAAQRAPVTAPAAASESTAGAADSGGTATTSNALTTTGASTVTITPTSATSTAPAAPAGGGGAGGGLLAKAVQMRARGASNAGATGSVPAAAAMPQVSLCAITCAHSVSVRVQYDVLPKSGDSLYALLPKRPEVIYETLLPDQQQGASM
jgi:hypothetical protein